MMGSADTAACRCGERPGHVALHFIDWLNSVFTVLKNCWFHRFLRNRINCVEIVAP